MKDVVEKCISSFSVVPFLQEGNIPEMSGKPPPSSSNEEEHLKIISKDIRGESSATGDQDYQKKIIPFHMLKLDEAEERNAVIESSKRLPMIVCASLLEKAPNLGGLTRTAEVFGLQSIVINDVTVMKSKDYTSVCVTADKWIKTEQVTTEELPAWLTRMRDENGYALVGLEQTSNSVSLADFSFPRKCILILGNEAKGVPAHLISMLTHVVEIPQLGTIRSLNVHVSASITIAQYVMQQLQ